jgi:hypothetical protein
MVFDPLMSDGSRGLMPPGSAVWEIQRRESDASHAETATYDFTQKNCSLHVTAGSDMNQYSANPIFRGAS